MSYVMQQSMVAHIFFPKTIALYTRFSLMLGSKTTITKISNTKFQSNLPNHIEEYALTKANALNNSISLYYVPPAM